MIVRKKLVGLMMVLAVLLAACGGPGADPTPGSGIASGQDSGAMADETPMATGTPDEMMVEETPMVTSTPDAIMHEETPMVTGTAEAMVDEETPMVTGTPDAMMNEETPEVESTAEAGMQAPAWFSAELIDVNSGQPFSIAGLQGQVILVETMAIWCPKCLAQQQQVQALRATLGERDDLAIVVLDVDPNENADGLKAYASGHGFDWIYAVAPREVAREIGQLYGELFLNPTSTPMLIVDRHGAVHPLPFGIKNAAELQEALEPFLSESM